MTMFKFYNLKGAFTALVTFFSISSYACGYDFVGQCATEAKFSVNTAQTNYLNPDCTYGSPLTPNFGSNITELKLTAGKTFTWESCTNNVIQSAILYRIYQNPSNKGNSPSYTAGHTWLVFTIFWKKRPPQYFLKN